MSCIWCRYKFLISKQRGLPSRIAESSAQEHVVGVPLVSFAYADEKHKEKLSCSALIQKRSKNLTTYFQVSYSEPLYFACQYSIQTCIISMIQIRKRSFTGWVNLYLQNVISDDVIHVFCSLEHTACYMVRIEFINQIEWEDFFSNFLEGYIIFQ